MVGEVIYAGHATDGMLPERSMQRLAAAMKRMQGQNVRLELVAVQPSRSLKANAYYWSCVIRYVTEMFQDAGNYVDDEDVHEFLKMRVGKLSRVIVTPDGEVVKTLGSTTKLTPSQFSDYIEKIRAWAAELGVKIPDADQFYHERKNHQ